MLTTLHKRVLMLPSSSFSFFFSSHTDQPSMFILWRVKGIYLFIEGCLYVLVLLLNFEFKSMWWLFQTINLTKFSYVPCKSPVYFNPCYSINQHLYFYFTCFTLIKMACQYTLIKSGAAIHIDQDGSVTFHTSQVFSTLICLLIIVLFTSISFTFLVHRYYIQWTILPPLTWSNIAKLINSFY